MSGKEKEHVDRDTHMAKAVAWWLALCGKVGVRSVEELVWGKFPGVCPYCLKQPHHNDICEQRKDSVGLEWSEISDRAERNQDSKPDSLRGWQTMFNEIYPETGSSDVGKTSARLWEEVGELSEAIRVFPVAPGYFLSEAADVFAWLMHLMNEFDSMEKRFGESRGRKLQELLANTYPEKCAECGHPICTCPPILERTLGRIGHEVREEEQQFREGGAFFPVDEARRLFELHKKTITLADQTVEIDAAVVEEIREAVERLWDVAIEAREISLENSRKLLAALKRLSELTSAQQVTEESLEELAESIAELPSDEKTVAMNVLSNIGSAPWAAALIQLIQAL